MKRRLGSCGDTIVEVLIAITVVSAVLGGAYVSSNRSLIVTRQSQERGEALKLAEEQLESLKAAGNSSTSLVYSYTSPADTFCMVNITPSSDPDDCEKVNGGAVYNLSITHDPANTFTVLVTWEPAGGGNEERLSLVYNMYPL